MATMGESSSAPLTSKPVIVRVKRKPFQSPVDALWLEINERPSKRPLLDFGNLSISDSTSQKEELNTKKVFVQHVETLSRSEVTFEVVQSFVDPGSSGASKGKSKIVERKSIFKKENKQDQLLLKAKQNQESVAKNARFEQIWKSRKENREAVPDKALQEMCHFYDIVRVDNEEKKEQQEDISLEDQRLLCSYLPLLREFIPNAAVEIESDILGHSKQEDYVYDIYTVNNVIDLNAEDLSNSYPLVQVDDQDLYDDPEESDDYETDDSNGIC
ncbi:RNA-directed DNA methylation 4 [Senna tora]|uniref:RNA-directed DNA methylation 4 n=1 Tax=Senna tora TaxID=362788 RepID=A0A834TL41_9FABA|nr:RNA-directed DNA methylation 4 [Senna tora]